MGVIVCSVSKHRCAVCVVCGCEVLSDKLTQHVL